MVTETSNRETLTEQSEADFGRAHVAGQEVGCAATYSIWLDAEVQKAIDATAPTVSHDEAMRRVRAAIKLV